MFEMVSAPACVKLSCSNDEKSQPTAASHVPHTLNKLSIYVHTCLMFKIASVFSVLTEKIEALGESLRSHFNIEEFSPVSLPAQVQSR